MRPVWILLGRILYPLSWPARVVYVRLGNDRTRLVIVSQGKVLMLKNWLGKGKWDLPGGGLHRGEHPVEGAIRELQEETGLRIPAGELEFLGKFTTRGPMQRYEMACYLVRLPTPTKAIPGYPEVIETAWLPLDDLLKSDTISPDTREILEKRAGTHL